MNKVILFDSDCLMCNSFVQFFYYLNKKYFYSPLNSNYSKSIIEKEFLSDIDSIFYVTDDKIFYFSSAIVRILIDSDKLVYKIFGVLLWLIPKPIRDLAYKKIAFYRIFISNKINNAYCNLDINKHIVY